MIPHLLLAPIPIGVLTTLPTASLLQEPSQGREQPLSTLWVPPQPTCGQVLTASSASASPCRGSCWVSQSGSCSAGTCSGGNKDKRGHSTICHVPQDTVPCMDVVLLLLLDHAVLHKGFLLGLSWGDICAVWAAHTSTWVSPRLVMWPGQSSLTALGPTCPSRAATATGSHHRTSSAAPTAGKDPTHVAVNPSTELHVFS